MYWSHFSLSSYLFGPSVFLPLVKEHSRPVYLNVFICEGKPLLGPIKHKWLKTVASVLTVLSCLVWWWLTSFGVWMSQCICHSRTNAWMLKVTFDVYIWDWYYFGSVWLSVGNSSSRFGFLSSAGQTKLENRSKENRSKEFYFSLTHFSLPQYSKLTVIRKETAVNLSMGSPYFWPFPLKSVIPKLTEAKICVFFGKRACMIQ